MNLALQPSKPLHHMGSTRNQTVLIVAQYRFWRSRTLFPSASPCPDFQTNLTVSPLALGVHRHPNHPQVSGISTDQVCSTYEQCAIGQKLRFQLDPKCEIHQIVDYWQSYWMSWVLKVKPAMRTSVPAALMVDPQSEPNHHGLVYWFQFCIVRWLTNTRRSVARASVDSPNWSLVCLIDISLLYFLCWISCRFRALGTILNTLVDSPNWSLISCSRYPPAALATLIRCTLLSFCNCNGGGPWDYYQHDLSQIADMTRMGERGYMERTPLLQVIGNDLKNTAQS